MSEIRVTTLKDTSGGNSSTTAEVFSGRAKAWANFNGQGVVALRANYNVNSITDNGVGDYTVNLSTAMSDAKYALTGAASRTSSGNNTISMSIEFNSNMTSSSFRVMTGMDNYNFTDTDTCCPAIFR